MKKLKIKLIKIAKNLKVSILKSAPSMVVIFMALTMLGLISALLSLSGAETSVTPFKLKYTNDWIILFFILSLLITSATFVTLSIKKKGLNKFVNYFGSYITVMTLADVIGLLMLKSERKVSTDTVVRMVKLTYGYNIFVIVMCVFGIVWGIYITRDNLNITNWWFIAVCLPYFPVLYQAAVTIAGLQTLTGYSDYSPKIVKIIVNMNRYGDINLINQSFYYIMSYSIIALIFMLGGKIIVFVYFKTKEEIQKIQEKIK